MNQVQELAIVYDINNRVVCRRIMLIEEITFDDEHRLLSGLVKLPGYDSIEVWRIDHAWRGYI